jgi:hypothetical protein
MLSVIPALAAAVALMQTPPVNKACALLTPAQVSSLVGTARTLPVTATASGSTCMFQNQDRTITVLMATASTADAAQGLFDAKKRIASGADVPGWGVPAYSGAMRTVAAVGVLAKQTMIEVKVIDKTQKLDEMVAKLQAVMKEVASRK